MQQKHCFVYYIPDERDLAPLKGNSVHNQRSLYFVLHFHAGTSIST